MRTVSHQIRATHASSLHLLSVKTRADKRENHNRIHQNIPKGNIEMAAVFFYRPPCQKKGVGREQRSGTRQNAHCHCSLALAQRGNSHWLNFRATAPSTASPAKANTQKTTLRQMKNSTHDTTKEVGWVGERTGGREGGIPHFANRNSHSYINPASVS